MKGSDVIMKGFSAFLDRRCKDARIMKSVPENISLSKDLFYQFPWSTESFPLQGIFPTQEDPNSVSFIAGVFSTVRTTREAQYLEKPHI